ncbi:MAG: hypothetical protein A2849_02830 [Candidatus Taylorbacteria bacterium RIFCSPHIGHO2_01_FULL_51_15]|uniref:DUF8128 domain-containing protein n=1 Tax=Candidatus Taylorbacteria bacterium RIFCSPHIGHO2_01_FULL_51_15 TaxID=1802304 RepID=A0A1G2MA55_9BACT|nr:MAG: hypothetical protein A2849_02830 [Candidatus Taylorbacteria bacterium RIFCSPHIGHO2_01_FULL_51_15]
MSHKESIGHRVKHYLEELVEIAAELFYELLTPPRGHGGGGFFVFWGTLVATAGIGFLIYFKQIPVPFGTLPLRVFDVVYTSYPIWLPILLLKLFLELWLKYIRLDYIKKAGEVLLEIRIPKEVTKTPKAMELFFMAMYETGAVEYNETYWDGKVRPWFSYEIASFGGDVHFYVWTLKKYQNVLEAQLYAQYPTVELVEVEDYARRKVFNPKENFTWGTYFVLQRPDPYPIMTYVDYGLDKEMEEEYKVDPLSTLLEYLGSMKKGEDVWIQILVQAYKVRGLKEGQLFSDKNWIAEGQKEVNKIMKRDPHTKSSRSQTKTGFPIIPTLTEGEKKQVEAIERSLDKRAFWCTVRLCYHADKEVIHLRSSSVSGLLGTFRKPFNSNLLNGFKLGWYTDISDPTKDFLFLFGLKNWAMNLYIPKYARLMVDAFRRRSFFYAPYRNWQSKPYILTAEELATMYHIPGKVVTTPTFERIPSKKVEPPANLPI